jgi:hypothetical protein
MAQGKELGMIYVFKRNRRMASPAFVQWGSGLKKENRKRQRQNFFFQA